MTSQYFYFTLFAIAAYLIATDASIAKLTVLLAKIVKFQYEKYRWILIYHHATPWARYMMWRSSMKIAKELMKELAEKEKKM